MRRFYFSILLCFALVGFPYAAPASAQPEVKPRIVCVDAGHPSEVGIGTRGKRLTEVGVCWQVALKLKTILQERGFKVVMTKTSERERVTNKRRAEIANRAQADLFVRLHCDYAPGESGTSTYYPDREGRAGKVRGPSKIVQQQSRAAAALFHPAMMAKLKGKLSDRGLHSDTHTAIGGKQGALTGSIYSRVPVLLVEMAALNTPGDEAFLAAESGQQQMAEALADGVAASLQSTR